GRVVLSGGLVWVGARDLVRRQAAVAIAPSTDAAVRGLGRHAPELVRRVAARVTVVGPGVAVAVEVRRRVEVDGQRLNARGRLGRIENDAVGLRRDLLRGLAALPRAAPAALSSRAVH